MDPEELNDPEWDKFLNQQTEFPTIAEKVRKQEKHRATFGLGLIIVLYIVSRSLNSQFMTPPPRLNLGLPLQLPVPGEPVSAEQESQQRDLIEALKKLHE